MSFLVQTPDGRWVPGIGDPTIGGWVTVVAYFAVAYFCHRARKHADALGPTGYRLTYAWRVLTVAMIALGINKQLDLQTLVTVIGRDFAMEGGWYERRHAVQVAFIAALIAATLVATGAAGWYMRRHLRHFALAGAGAAFLGCFVLVRASSFHNVDFLLRNEHFGLPMNWILELGGITCIGLNARAFIRKKLRPKRVAQHEA